MSTVDRSLRFRILREAGFKCRYCGRQQGDGIALEVDHVMPKSRGGSNHRDNLVAACFDCNRGKRDSLGVLPPPDEYIAGPELPEGWPVGAFFHYVHDEASAAEASAKYSHRVDANDVTYQGRIERVDADCVWVRLFSFLDGGNDGSLQTLPIEGWRRFRLYKTDREMRFAYTAHGVRKGWWPQWEVDHFDENDRFWARMAQS